MVAKGIIDALVESCEELLVGHKVDQIANPFAIENSIDFISKLVYSNES